MKSTHLVVALLAVLFASAMAQDAQAQRLYGYRNGFGPGGYNGCGSSLYSLGRIPVPPYFALHPPVYYSGIRPTTYGSTPFAKRPSRVDFPVHELPGPAAKPTSSPVRSVQAPKVVLNPFVNSSEDLDVEKPAKVQTVRVILNPFVREEASKLARAQ
jgi:hypothetical protein